MCRSVLDAVLGMSFPYSTPTRLFVRHVRLRRDNCLGISLGSEVYSLSLRPTDHVSCSVRSQLLLGENTSLDL